ncbi:DMP19 family protein [Luteimonas sp. Y-2-2-4F]|nr:DUF4375 domain-containing protein [Luteimonas sp. Y-2-2-4F]MCD9032428.1 DMP19 family protein [Luteimonas sp. Y-2-2-4F]
MSAPPSQDAVVVSRDALDSDDPYDLVGSGIAFVNALIARHLRRDELSSDALRSYYVDYYLAQVNNGGFSQFVYNSGWDGRVVADVRDGLEAMGAREHRALFERGAALVEALGAEGLQAFFSSEYFGDNATRDGLDALSDAFYDLSDREDLVRLNAAWLRRLPHLAVLAPEQMEAEVERRAAALPDREAREAEARAGEPRYAKLIRALCAATGQTLDRVTAGDPAFAHAGQQTVAWHFLTDRGHFYMVDLGDRALMFDGGSNRLVHEIPVPEAL